MAMRFTAATRSTSAPSDALCSACEEGRWVAGEVGGVPTRTQACKPWPDPGLRISAIHALLSPHELEADLPDRIVLLQQRQRVALAEDGAQRLVLPASGEGKGCLQQGDGRPY